MHFQPIYGFGHLLYSRKMNIKGPFAIIENISLKDLVKKSMKLKASLIIIKGQMSVRGAIGNFICSQLLRLSDPSYTPALFSSPSDKRISDFEEKRSVHFVYGIFLEYVLPSFKSQGALRKTNKTIKWFFQWSNP